MGTAKYDSAVAHMVGIAIAESLGSREPGTGLNFYEIDAPRQSGKTASIVDEVQPGDIIVTVNHFVANEIKERLRSSPHFEKIRVFAKADLPGLVKISGPIHLNEQNQIVFFDEVTNARGFAKECFGGPQARFISLLTRP